jgi:hypothetical protein
MNNTPETDAEASYPDSSLGECVDADFARKLERERDEAREDLKFRRGFYKVQEQYLNTATRERDQAREQIKELIYIAQRAIALAEIDFENDKFGAVSELRDGLERIKEGAK